MDRLALFIAALLPAAPALAYVVIKARADWRGEWLWSAVLMGAIGMLPVIGAGGLCLALVGADFDLSHWSGSLLFASAVKAFLFAAIPEEAIKFLILVCIVERHVDLRRLQDLLPAAVAVSIGFAALENLFYVTQSPDGWKVAVARAATAVPGHCALGLLMGSFLIFARTDAGARFRHLMAALGVPILAHGAYDLPMMRMQMGPWHAWHLAAWLAILAVLGVAAIRLSNGALLRARQADRHGAEHALPAAPGFISAIVVVVMVGVPLAVYSLQGARWGLVGPWLAVGILPLMFAFDLGRWHRRAAASRLVSSA